MSEFKSALRAYDLDKALAADRGADCLIIEVGRNERGEAVASLQRVADQVDHYIHDVPGSAFAATKLYIIGKWTLIPNVSEEETGGEVRDTEVNEIIFVPCTASSSMAYKASTLLIHLEQQARIDAVMEWHKATEKLSELLKQLGNLRELTQVKWSLSIKYED
jgi:hypothetical protein